MIENPASATTRNLRWYLVQCKPNAAQIAIRNLKNQSFDTFLPLQEITKRKGTMFQRQIRPLFPGYIFVQLNPSKGPWRQINSTRGIARLVSLGAEANVVPDSIVAELMARCDDQQVLRQKSDAQAIELQTGKQAQVTQGPLSGFVAKIIQIEPNNRINILIEAMGQTTKVALDASALQSIAG